VDQPLAQPTAPPTPVIAPTAPAFGMLLAGLVKDQPGWPNDPVGTAWLDGAQYRLFAREPGRFVGVSAPLVGMSGDVVVSAAFHKLSGPRGGGYGVIVRDQRSGPRDGLDQGGQFYVAEADDIGEVGMWRREDDHWVDLLPWTPSKAVYPGGTTNELILRVEGQRLTFLVNGVEVTTQFDSTLSSGRVGVFVGGDLNNVVLDRFTVYVPPTGTAR
jgi:hypothetical protein